jgi:uncharacterized coiled-coil protein SlyX
MFLTSRIRASFSERSGVGAALVGAPFILLPFSTAWADDSAQAQLDSLRAQLSRQEALIAAQQKQLAEQQQAIDRLSRSLAPQTSAAGASPKTASAATVSTGVQIADVPATPFASVHTAAASEAITPPGKNRYAGADAPPGGLVVVKDPDFSLTLGGNIKVLAYYSAARAYVPAAAFLLYPKDPTGKEDQFRLTGQYSSLTAAATGPKIGSFQSGAFVGATLVGGSLTSATYGVTPFNAYAYLKNQDWMFAAGLNFDVFSPRIPDMVDSIADFANSGNPGNSYRTQVRVEHYVNLGEAGKLTMIGAIAEPISLALSGDLQTRTENNGIPNTEGNLSWASSPAPESALLKWPRVEVGVSGIYGETRTFLGGVSEPVSVVVTRTYGYSLDGGVRLTDRLGIQGEIYHGHALGNYLGNIGQTFDAAGRPLQGNGGWAEAVYYLNPRLQTHAGWAADEISNKRDQDPAKPTFNETIFANLRWNWTPGLRLGMEGTWHWTHYVNGLNVPARNNSGPAVMLSSEYRF